MAKQLLGAAAVIWSLVLPAAAGAQNTTIAICFPNTANIVGTVTLEKFAGCIGATSAALEFAVPAVASAAGGATASKPVFAPFKFTKIVDSASPSLFLAGVSGTRIATADVHFLVLSAEKPAETATVSLGEVAVAAVKIAAADGVLPTEEVSLTYGRICITSGSSTNCFNIASGTAS